MASHSQLKYGARLINSYLGNNATISCCEVLNSLIFPAHEQHHNNSFLCAALIMGQSNMAAGATIGSNHNSRGADGEVIAGRGFWPGLCVSLKHNSRFASFTLIAKGTYMYEMDIPFPFSLVLNDEQSNSLKIMTGYWFLHNMYALARNSWKYVDRDKRTDKTQLIEYDYLAPDSVEEMIHTMSLMEIATGKAWYAKHGPAADELSTHDLQEKGKELLVHDPEIVAGLQIFATDVENSSRKVQLLKVHRSYPLFRELINLYAVRNIFSFIEQQPGRYFSSLRAIVETAERSPWHNVGGQLMKEETLTDLKDRIRTGAISGWDELHENYRTIGEQYTIDKLQHAIASLLYIEEKTARDFTPAFLKECLLQSVHIQTFLTESIYHSRAKDYQNPFRQMTYENEAEMDAVIGKLDDNSFIQQTLAELKTYKKKVSVLIEEWGLSSTPVVEK
jgi:hypothetical protein